jgi:hypothetical protein
MTLIRYLITVISLFFLAAAVVASDDDSFRYQ